MVHDFKLMVASEMDSRGGRDLISQCVCCQLVRHESPGGQDRFFHRGTRTEDHGCADDKPIPLDRILSRHNRDAPLARKVWLVIHYNAPLTHGREILRALAELLPECASVFRDAIRHREQAAEALLKEVFRDDPLNYLNETVDKE